MQAIPIIGHAVVDDKLPPPAQAASFNNEVAVRDYLSRKSWPAGLQNALINGLQTTPARFFICDNSGSMRANDGHRVVGESNALKVVPCPRWTELTESLRFHVGLAHAAYAPTEFRMLNGAAPIYVGQSAEDDVTAVPIITKVLDGSPVGLTPLCFHISEVVKQIANISPELLATGKKAAIIIMTDGEASDGQVAAAMRQLYHMPVWVVVRLCTDENNVIEYWNNVDSEVELSMDVIDDPLGEAKEIQRLNKWLTYGEPLHRLREFGVTAREMDLIDEATLSKEQMKLMCAFIFNVPHRSLPEPEADWDAFSQRISALNDSTPMVFNPVTRRMCKWIDMNALNRVYSVRGVVKKTGKGGGCCTS